MATLFERPTGIGLPDNPTLSERRINVHVFCAQIMMMASDSGGVTRGSATNLFNLTEDQADDAVYFYGRAASAPDMAGFMMAFKNWLYCADLGAPGFTRQADLVTYLQDVLAAQVAASSSLQLQGGTLP